MSRFVLLAALFALPSLVIAQQKPAYVVQFNGHFLTISVTSIDTPFNFEPADEKATQICGTVGKKPELQNREKVTQYRFFLNYVCI